MKRTWRDRFAAVCGSALSTASVCAAFALSIASALASFPVQADTGSNAAAAATTYAWDANGQLASKTQATQVTHFTFNALHQLVGVALPNATKIGYTYGPDGNIASRSKTTPQAAKSTTHYLVDPTARFPQIVAEYDDQGHLTATFLYGDELLARRKAGVDTYFEHDGHGSVVVLTDVNGGATQTYSYDAWGNGVEASGSDDNEFRYTGELQDPDTGLIYLRARWYDPVVGRFISSDNVESVAQQPVSANPYLYAEGDPTSKRDPSGHVTVGELATSVGISVSINIVATVANGNYSPDALASAATWGVVEGLAFVGAAKLVVKGGAAFYRATRSLWFLRQLQATFALVKGERLIPGFNHLFYRMIVQTKAGRILFQSGENATTGEVSGAMKHIVEEVLKKSGGAANSELAEAVVIQELSAIGTALTEGEAEVVANGLRPYVLVRTQGVLWEVGLGFDSATSLVKIYHLVPKEFF